MSRELILVPKKRYDLLKQKALIVSEQEEHARNHNNNNNNKSDNTTNSENHVDKDINNLDSDESERKKEQTGEGINKQIPAVQMSFDTFDKIHKGKIKNKRQYGGGNDVRRKWLSFKF